MMRVVVLAIAAAMMSASAALAAALDHGHAMSSVILPPDQIGELIV